MCDDQRNHSVAERPKLVHASGSPIIQDTNAGFRSPPAVRRRHELFDDVVPIESDAVGVGSRGVFEFPNSTASVRLTPACALLPVRFLEPDAFASPAVGVGQSPFRAIVSRLGVPALGRLEFDPFCELPYCAAFGVGSQTPFLAMPCSEGVSPIRSPLLLEPPPFEGSTGVGSKEEEPLSEMRRSDFGRAEQTPLRIEPLLGQSCEDVGKSSSNKPRHVLQEDESRSYLANDPGDVGPEPPFVLGAEPLAGRAERLAREARRDAIHDSTPRAAVEGFEIRPQRRCIQASRFHLARQDFAAEGFPLHHADCSSSWNGKSESEGDAADPGT